MLREHDPHGFPRDEEPARRRNERLAAVCGALSIAFAFLGLIVVAVALYALTA